MSTGFHRAGCCCRIGLDCAFCTFGRTPKFYDVVVAGITACVCQTDGLNSAEAVCTIDANFRVTQTTNCTWQNLDAGIVQVWWYFADDCTGAFRTDTGTAEATLYRLAGNTFRFQIRSTKLDLGFGWVFPRCQVFDGTKVTVNCDMNFVIDNTEVCAYNGIGPNAFYLCENGTASFTPV